MDGRISQNFKKGYPWTAKTLRISKRDAGIHGRPNQSENFHRDTMIVSL